MYVRLTDLWQAQPRTVPLTLANLVTPIDYPFSMRVFPQLRPPERVLASFIAALLCLDAILGAGSTVDVDWLAYGGIIGVSCATLMLGLYLRTHGWPRLGLSIPAFALYSAFGAAIALACYLATPISRALIDPALVRADARLGFSWPHYIGAFAHWPVLAKGLGWVYTSALVQLCAVIFILGREPGRLDRFMFTSLVSCTAACMIWFIFPSAGPSSVFTLPDQLSQRLGLVIDNHYGNMVRNTIQHGPQTISPWVDRGLVSFPSFHTIMALLVVWFLRGKGWLFAFVVALNTAMLPSILLHGGHNLIDVLGGICVFALSLCLTNIYFGLWNDRQAESVALKSNF